MRATVRILLFSALTGLLACQDFTRPPVVPEASGPIAAGAGRLLVQNELDVPVLQAWYAECLGAKPPVKVYRTIAVGGSTQHDAVAGCVRATFYPRQGAIIRTITAVEGEVTVVRLRNQAGG